MDVEITEDELAALSRREQESLNRLIGPGVLRLRAERHSDRPDSIFVMSREQWDLYRGLARKYARA